MGGSPTGSSAHLCSIDGWRLQTSRSATVRLEKEFTEETVGDEEMRFFFEAVARANIELQLKNFKKTRAGFIILFMDAMLKKCMS